MKMIDLKYLESGIPIADLYMIIFGSSAYRNVTQMAELGLKLKMRRTKR